LDNDVDDANGGWLGVVTARYSLELHAYYALAEFIDLCNRK